jgi:Dolichyl-phosphate-mannose-protein mannosyltransferase
MTSQMKRQSLGIIVALLFSFYYFRTSQFAGRLRFDIAYDDIIYVNDATDRVNILFNLGVFEFVKSFFVSPAHSPFSTLLASVALIVGGKTDEVFYLANSLLLVIAVVFLVFVFKSFDRLIVLSVTLLFLSAPMAFEIIEQFRPDFALGFATTAMSWFVLTAIRDNSDSDYKKGGIAFGLALLIKPTFFMHTVAIAFGLIIISFFAHRMKFFATTSAVPYRWSYLALFLGIGITIASPHYIFAAQQIFGYFWSNTRGTNAYIWSLPSEMPLFSVAGVFLTDAYQHALGLHGLIAICLALSGLAINLYRKKLEQAYFVSLLLAVAIASFIILVVGRHKNEFFFATFQLLLLLSGAYGLSSILAHTEKIHLNKLVFVFLVALAGATYFNRVETNFSANSEASRHDSWNERTIQIIKDARKGRDVLASNPSAAVFVSVSGPVNSDTVKWVGAKKSLDIDAFIYPPSVSLSDALIFARRSDFVVLPNLARAQYPKDFPSAKIQAGLALAIRADQNFKLLNPNNEFAHYFVFENSGKSFFINRVLDLPELATVTGFRDEEGPYPNLQLPRLVWLTTAKSSLCVPTGMEYQIEMRLRGGEPGTLNARLTPQSDTVLGTFEKGNLKDISFRHKFSLEEPCITLEPTFVVPPPEGLILLFTRLKITKID